MIACLWIHLPFFTIFAASANIWECQNAIECIDEEQQSHTECWLKRDVESTIAVQQCRLWSFCSCLLLHDEHWNFRAITAWIENLLNRKIVLVKSVQIQFHFTQNHRLSVGLSKIVAIDCAWCQKWHQLVKHFRILFIAAECNDLTDFKREFANQFARFKWMHLQSTLKLEIQKE